VPDAMKALGQHVSAGCRDRGPFTLSSSRHA
jgi:hypothetical protein